MLALKIVQVMLDLEGFNMTLTGSPMVTPLSPSSPSWWQQFKSWRTCTKVGCLLAALALIGGSVAVGVTVKNNKDAAKQQQLSTTTITTKGQIQTNLKSRNIAQENSRLSSTSYQDLFAEPVGGLTGTWPGADTKAIFVGASEVAVVDYVVTQPTVKSFSLCYIDLYGSAGDTLTRSNGCRNVPLSGNIGTFVADNAPIIHLDDVMASESAILVPTDKDEKGAQKHAKITLPNDNERITGVSKAFSMPAWHENNVVVTTTHNAYIVGYPLKGDEDTYSFAGFVEDVYCHAAWVGNFDVATKMRVLATLSRPANNALYFHIFYMHADGLKVTVGLHLPNMAGPQETPAEERGNYDAATVMHNANIVANADETRWLVTLGTSYRLIELSEDGSSLHIVPVPLDLEFTIGNLRMQPNSFTKAAFVQPLFKLADTNGLFDAGIIAVATSNNVMFYDRNHEWIDTAEYENGKIITETVVVHMHADLKYSAVLDFTTKKDYMDRTPAVTVYTPTTRHVVPMPPKVLLRYMGIETAQYNFVMQDGNAVPDNAEVTFQEAPVFGVYVAPAAGAAAASGQSLFCMLIKTGEPAACTEIATGANPVTPVAFHADGTHFFVAFDNNKFAYGLIVELATKLQELSDFDIDDDAIVTGASMFSDDLGGRGVVAAVSTTRGSRRFSLANGALISEDIGFFALQSRTPTYAISNLGDLGNECFFYFQLAEGIIAYGAGEGAFHINVPNLKRQGGGQTTAAAAASIQCKNNVVLATIDNSWVVVDLNNAPDQQGLSATVEDSRVVATFLEDDADTDIVAIATKTYIKTVEYTGTYTRAKHLDSDSDDDDDEIVGMVYDADEREFVLARSKSGMQTVPLLLH